MSTDPKAFWASLEPAHAIALIDAAPRVAGPWEQLFRSATWTRQGAGGAYNAWGKFEAKVQVGNLIEMKSLGRFYLVEEAMQAVDAWLLANGWLLRG